MRILPDSVFDQHIAITGKVGSGKTYAARGFVERLLTNGRRVCIIDPTGAWHGLRSSADGKRPGFPVVVFGGDHGDVPITAESAAPLARMIAEQNLPCVIDVSGLLIGEQRQFMAEFAEKIFQNNRKPLHLVIDEADIFAPQNPQKGDEKMLHRVDRIVRRGRIRGFRVTLISQRPAVLHKNVLTQANVLITMRLTAPQDRKALEEWIKGQGDTEKGRQVLASLASLPTGEGWAWAPELEILERMKFPRITTFDSGRTPDDDGGIPEPVRLADVDLTEINAALADAIKEAAENDPKLLRKEIARLKAELAKKPATTGLTNEDMDRAHALGRIEGIAEGFDQGVSKMMTLVAAAVVDVRASMEERFASLDAAAAGKPAHDDMPGARAAFERAKAGAVRPLSPVPVRTARPESLPNVMPQVEGLTGPMQRILDALAWLESIGVSPAPRLQVVFFSGYSHPNSKGFANSMSAASTAGLVESGGGKVALTSEGRAIARKPDRPATTADLHRMIFSGMDGPTRRILEPLIACYPGTLSRAELCERANYGHQNSKGFANAMSRLRSLGLLDYPSTGQVIASDMLFLER